MKIFDYIIYVIIGILTFVKCFAVSKGEIQDYCAYGIFSLSSIYIFFNIYRIKADDLIALIIIYLLSLFLSAIYLTSFLNFSNFLNSLLFPLIFLSSYIFFQNNPKSFIFLKYIGLIGVVLSYFNLLRLSAEININTTNALQSNAGNTLVAFLPFVILWKNKIIKYSLLTLIFLGCLIALKRSGFIIFLLVIFAYFSMQKQKKFIFNSIVALIIVCVFGFVILPNIEFAQPLIERLLNLSEDGGSGRDSLALLGLKLQFESTYYEWILGHGYLGFSHDLEAMGKFFTCAHNDFIEILYDAGIISLILFLFILLKMIKISKDMYVKRNTYMLPFISCFIVFLCANMFVCSFVHFWYYLPMYCVFGASYSLSKYSKHE